MASLRLSALAMGAAALCACAPGGDDDDDDAAPDAGADAAVCAANECAVGDGTCQQEGTCHPDELVQRCSGGEWQSSCGNFVCDCGETLLDCAFDCGCEGNDCADEDVCVPPAACRADGTPNVCVNGEFEASCGDHTCNCGETFETCQGDCPPAAPFWSECRARSGQWLSCDEYCEAVGLQCEDVCTTSDGKENAGAESWPEGASCEGPSSSNGDCNDQWDDDIGAEPHWRCCCGA